MTPSARGAGGRPARRSSRGSSATCIWGLVPILFILAGSAGREPVGDRRPAGDVVGALGRGCWC